MDSQPRASSVLVLERRNELIQRMEEAFAGRGYNICTCQDPDEALARGEKEYFDLIFMADRLSGDSSNQALARMLDAFPDAVVTVFSQNPSTVDAVEFMRLGAFNYMGDPTDNGEVLAAADLALEFRKLREDNNGPARSTGPYDVENIIGASQPMQAVFKLIHKVATTDATVLILGESGTGKELVARAIHHHSKRAESPLIPVNCGAIPSELLESELFGHEKGAFTGAIKSRPGRFELAESGSIFLDEIGDMSPMLQVKLLRVLQEHRFERVGGTKSMEADIRVIAATHRNLAQQVEEEKFREDLYYRLNVVPIRVPPLRERRSDIALLTEHFLKRLSEEKGLTPKTISPEVQGRLRAYDWPGNVRELENLIERMMILADEDVITLEDLPPKLSDLEPVEDAPAAPREMPEEGLDFNQAVAEFETGLILQALERTNWVKNRAATLLKLNRTTLVEKIKKKGLEKPAS